MESAFTNSAQDVLAHFNVTEQKGLSEQAVLASREKHGKNGTPDYLKHEVFSADWCI